MSPGILTAIIAATVIFIAAISALVYWYAFRFEPVNFKVSNIKINLMKNAGIKDDAAPGFTILHLSDFHLRKDRKGEKLFSFIQSLSSYNPDFVFITGDLVEDDMYSDYLMEMLEGLNAKIGKYAVLGVHDYYNKTPKEFLKNMIKRKKEYRRENDVSKLISKLGGIGIKVLRNEIASHIVGEGLSIKIIGLEDSIIGKTDLAKTFGKYWQDDKENIVSKDLFVLDKSNIHILNNAQKIEICLTHTPEMGLFGQLVENGVDIILAGHTHGGQVRLPGIGAIISGCDLKVKYASGLFYFKKFILYVSRGLGEGRYSPFRFYCQPEATIIKVSFCLSRGYCRNELADKFSKERQNTENSL